MGDTNTDKNSAGAGPAKKEKNLATLFAAEVSRDNGHIVGHGAKGALLDQRLI